MDKFRKRLDKVKQRRLPKPIKTEPHIGIVIGTYGSKEYIELQLKQRDLLYPNTPVLVHDDCSGDGELRRICSGVDFYSTPKRLGWCRGDIHAYAKGLEWASTKKIDYLIKLSRRFVPRIDLVADLRKLVKKTPYHTYNNICTVSGYGFRTECCVMHVPSWLPLVGKIRKKIEGTTQHNVWLVEGFIHGLAKSINNDDTKGFVTWPFMGISRRIRNPNFYWHQTHKKSEVIDGQVQEETQQTQQSAHNQSNQ